ncbi:MAG TPA: hypothetical protein VMM80_02835 [Bacteroidota bacterium]|nr:hypothetical protein [Bacteroidota bacterium]
MNAFISAEAHGVAEIGFHGSQPPSRNSRMLVRAEGVLTVSIRQREETAFSCAEVEWVPGRARTMEQSGGTAFSLDFIADGRRIRLRVEAGEPAEADVVVRFSAESMFTAVQGERAWRAPRLEGKYVRLDCRDRIMLPEWMRRTGPYAGDFLIPERVRRRIFRRRCRSGLATYDDLLPEYRDREITLYDAGTSLRLGGEGFTPGGDSPSFTFEARLAETNGYACEFVVACADDATPLDAPEDPPIPPQAAEPPRLTIPGFDATSGFFATVPGIVRSATLRETGMTRASAGAYYWIWAWDAMVSAIEMPLWGDSAGAASVARFIDAHRDDGGAIPARWSHALEPMDTPPRGAMDFLLLLLALRCAQEGEEPPSGIYSSAARALDDASASVDSRGLAANLGFYPDLPVAFGRTDGSAAAIETGALYAFCRLMESAALERGDAARAGKAKEIAGRILRSFARTYFDAGEGFFIDAVDVAGEGRNETFPLFTLLFLQTPLGVPLLRPHTAEASRFARENFQQQFGTRLIPGDDTRAGNEDALSSWYPHWDVYLLKLFRRGKEREGIITWLRSAERLLGKLGYAPEFIRMEGLGGDDPEAWRRHGAVSNLNCATGWYRALLEGILGIEFDTGGGMTHVPLDLDIPAVTLEGLKYRGSAWAVSTRRAGGPTPELRIDGERLNGCTKVPRRFYDRRSHRLDIAYTASAGGPLFTEIVNAEVIEAEGDPRAAHVGVNALGTVDIAFTAGAACALSVDGARVPFSLDPGTGTYYAQLDLAGTHTLALTMNREKP